MELFTELSKTEMAGLILIVAMIPFIILSVKNLLLSKNAVHWPKVSGVISQIRDYGAEVKFSLAYTYAVNNIEYESSRIIFSSSTIYTRGYAIEFESKYSLHQKVEVYYNPEKPLQAVLEPGKTSAASSIIFLTILLALGALAFFNDALLLQLLDQFSQLFN
ncbi:MAG: DUF3592 domain-containing protein [Draconibacterium sp.]